MVVHPQTKKKLEAFLKSPSHSLLLAGPRGSGKNKLAQDQAEALLKLNSGKFENFAYGLIVRPSQTNSISIEAIRQLDHFLSLRVPWEAEFKRAVIIEEAEALTIEAQNALLKTLEEPPAGTLIIMTTASDKQLLPTIISRTTVVPVKTPSSTDLIEYFTAAGHGSSDIERAIAMSGGLPVLMHAILEDDEHELMVAAGRSRELLSQPIFDRLLAADELARQRALTENILIILQQMARISLKKSTGKAAVRWQKVLAASYEAGEELRQNGQPKLVLTKLMLAL